MLLLARSQCQSLGLPHPSCDDILAATGASRSRAYELRDALVALLPTLTRRPGRPAGTPEAAPSAAVTHALTGEVLSYVMQHPGCVNGQSSRQWYSDAFRHFIVALRGRHPDLAFDTFAELVAVPAGTLKGWLAPATAEPEPKPHARPSEASAAGATTACTDATLPQIETVLDAWTSWHGTFVDFADHVRHHLRVPMGRQLIAHILEATGARLRQRRGGRSADELAMRHAFEVFFPGAQWVGDGKAVTVSVGGETFTFNLELEVDTHSSAVVGLSVRDTEDSAAVLESFEAGVATTGAAPLAQLLDNKPSNHTAEVAGTLEQHGTLRIRATPARPENKAHVEGCFGLFSQEVPPITLETRQSSHDVARALLLLVGMTWVRALNRRPRRDRGGLSRIEIYNQKPTAEQVAAARAALEERCRRQELARATLAARESPEVAAFLDANFLRLGLIDPERHVRLAIGRYPFDAIVDGVAIFDSKRRVGTLPEGADARYLLGIVRNVSAQVEGETLAKTMLALRLEAHDQAIAVLASLRAAVAAPSRDALEVTEDCVERALAADRVLDRTFWLDTLADQITERAVDADDRDRLYFASARRINTTFRVAPRERQHALRRLADRLVTLS